MILNPFYQAEDEEAAATKLGEFLDKWAGKYPKLANFLASQEGLFEFLHFPAAFVQAFILQILLRITIKA